MPRMYIPEIGDLLSLAAEWEFLLHQERRNNDVWAALDCDDHPSRAGHEARRQAMIAERADIEARMVPYTGPRAWGGSGRMNYASEADRDRDHDLRYTLYEDGPPVQVTFPRKTVLRVDRIYIRKGNEDFSSLTFFVVESPLAALTPTEFKKKVGSKGRRRFWAKLSDVNTMQFDRIEE